MHIDFSKKRFVKISLLTLSAALVLSILSSAAKNYERPLVKPAVEPYFYMLPESTPINPHEAYSNDDSSESNTPSITEEVINETLINSGIATNDQSDQEIKSEETEGQPSITEEIVNETLINNDIALADKPYQDDHLKNVTVKKEKEESTNNSSSTDQNEFDNDATENVAKKEEKPAVFNPTPEELVNSFSPASIEEPSIQTLQQNPIVTTPPVNPHPQIAPKKAQARSFVRTETQDNPAIDSKYPIRHRNKVVTESKPRLSKKNPQNTQAFLSSNTNDIPTTIEINEIPVAPKEDKVNVEESIPNKPSLSSTKAQPNDFSSSENLSTIHAHSELYHETIEAPIAPQKVTLGPVDFRAYDRYASSPHTQAAIMEEPRIMVSEMKEPIQMALENEKPIEWKESNDKIASVGVPRKNIIIAKKIDDTTPYLPTDSVITPSPQPTTTQSTTVDPNIVEPQETPAPDTTNVPNENVDSPKKRENASIIPQDAPSILSQNEAPASAPAEASSVTPKETSNQTAPDGDINLPAVAPITPSKPTEEVFTETAVDSTTEQTSKSRAVYISFNNVNIIEYIRYISKISNRNFIFDENDLQFNVTIMSEEPTTVEDTLTALLQILRIHDLTLVEVGNNFIIHKNAGVNNVAKVLADNLGLTNPGQAELVTEVFQLHTLDSENAAAVIRPMISTNAQVESLRETNHLIVTDLVTNVEKIALLLKSMDSPNSGLTIGQYVVRNVLIDPLLELADKVVKPITQGQPVYFSGQASSNSIFIVSTPYLLDRIIPILQRLDQNDGTTGIYDLNSLQFQEYEKRLHDNLLDKLGGNKEGAEARGSDAGINGQNPDAGKILTSGPEKGYWLLDPTGNWQFMPGGQKRGEKFPPNGNWVTDPQGKWYFENNESGLPGGGDIGPKGHWVLTPDGIWVFELDAGASISSTTRIRASRLNPNLPVGNVEKLRFYVHKLIYRRGDMVEAAIRKIGLSLIDTEDINSPLIGAINSVQWMEESNSIIITGLPDAINRVRILIEEIDIPLRQVFIEMLIMDMALDDSLNYSVNWQSSFGGGNVAGADTFVSGASPLANNQSTTQSVTSQTTTNSTTGISQTTTNATGSQAPVVNPPNPPNAVRLLNPSGYSLGIIGQHIVNTATGIEYNTIAALVQAQHVRTTSNILLNPKIIAEDRAKAEIFVGINTSFKTQSVSNDQGNVITSNFEFRDVGTRLTVTPYITPSGMITLEIEEEVSSILTTPNTNSNNNINNQSQGPTTRKNKSHTILHVPNKAFVIMSGMINDEEDITLNQVPCLGGIPIIGALFKDRSTVWQKRNLMIFIRPQIVETEEEIRFLTRHQQDIMKVKRNFKCTDQQEVDDALNFMNLRGGHECDELNPWEY